MSIGQSGHVNQPMLAPLPPTSTSKLQVQRSQSQNIITIHFSALNKKDEEDPLYGTRVNDSEEHATTSEAKEDLVYDNKYNSAGDVAVLSGESLPSTSSQRNTSCLEESVGISAQLDSSAMAAKQPAPPNTAQSSPSKSLSMPSIDKAFFSLMKSLSIEPQEGILVAPSMRPRKLMKGPVKSWSIDNSQECPESNRSPESRLQLFKQFTQPRSTVAWDPKTAPSSPLPSTENQTYSFKVSDVEACFEDTKRRLSEVISDPKNLISKLIGDENTNIYRPKALSSNASELGNPSTSHVESNKNYSIKEKEDNVEDEHTSGIDELALADESRTIKPISSSLNLNKCSMSALVEQEDKEFCELYSDDFEDFESCTEADGDSECIDDSINGESNQSEEIFSKSDLDIEPTSDIPYKTLLGLTLIIYGYFVLPLSPYVGGMLLGVALGFMLTIGAVWLAGPKRTGSRDRFQKELRNVAHLDINEPVVFKGWMNEIQDYDPETYHATLTRSVFVRLEGTTLRLSKPNKNIPRRASYSEPKPEITYISQRIYKLTDSKVNLVPQSLARKRIWNKKYPICIELGKQDDFISKAEGENSEMSEEREKERFVTLYLFGRTGREKEEWFRRILLASKHKSDAAKKSSLPLSHSSSQGSLDELTVSAKHIPLMDYKIYMASYMPPQTESSLVTSPVHSQQGSPEVGKKLPSSPVNEEGSVSWLNAVIGRIAWDFFRERQWVDLVSKKIQMKLSKIRLPYFMNELKLTELDMGHCTPRILMASQPSVDHQGLWFDLEISYLGSFLMTFETKMNLVRLKEGEGLGEIGKEGVRPRTYCLADSDEESSSAGSSDEEDITENFPDKSIASGADGYTGVHKPSKIMRFVDKLAKNKYFQKATETEFIKKKIEEVSNTPLLLTVEIQECRGILAVNIPPPPTDRIWYGFRNPPHLELRARPKLGGREVTLAPVTDWIEKKLDKEFQKLLVMPNMDDVWLNIMHSANDPRSGTSDTKSEQCTSETEILGSEDV